MGSDLDSSVALIAVAPFLAAILAPWIRRFVGPLAGWMLAIIPAAIFIFLLGFLDPVASGTTIHAGLRWIPAYGIDFSFMVDGLSLVFALLISGIGVFIVIYSGGYLAGHPHQGRFLAYMLMFMGSMLGLVLADNLITLFVFWELTSITSFLLIGFDHTRQAARRAAFQSLVITGGGGLVLLAGFILIMVTTGQNSLSGLLAAGRLEGHAAYLPILLLVLTGAFAKSAQFPFHFWLPNAMEAPTPVSAYLHSATMVKAGVYLLARMHPVLGDTAEWFWLLGIFGGVTLLVGATLALRQTDLKQMLAYTTLGSLGLLVMLIGLGLAASILAMVLYLCAHALFKAALFMAVGTLDHGTGTRDITQLGGLREVMPVTFIASLFAVASMIGVPVLLGFYAKEEMYLALTAYMLLPLSIPFLVVMIAGNAMMMAAGLLVAIRPYSGPLLPTPHDPHEGSLPLYIGPVVLGVAGLLAGGFIGWLNPYVAAGATAIGGAPIGSNIYFALDPLAPAVWASIVTWLLGFWLFWKADAVRSVLRRTQAAVGWTFDMGFDAVIAGLIRFADLVTRTLHHGRLEFYLLLMLIVLALTLHLPMMLTGSMPAVPAFPVLAFYEWGAILIAVIGLAAVLLARTRLVAIVALGIQGFAVAVIFMLFGAPDLSFTQFMVETLSVIILALVMTRLHLDQRDHRDLETAVRDGALAIAVATGFAFMMLAVLQTELDLSLTRLFEATSAPIAHGRNIVNVILVDYRAVDTLGEISVVMAAGLAIYALIRFRASVAPKPAPRRSRRMQA